MGNERSVARIVLRAILIILLGLFVLAGLVLGLCFIGTRK
jgi:hypothetical protein